MTLLNSSKKFFAVASIFAVTFLFSCQDEKKTQEAESSTTTETTTEEVPTKSSDVALNPAHGEPGHRCDIPVGAPLDSPKNTPQTQTQQSPVINQEANTNTTATGDVNPAHGQPGHRCDIPVGAPLNQ